MQKDKPKISVIMPFYNAERFLSLAIESVLNQTFKDFEFIIINDASADKSDDIVKRYLNDSRIIYVVNDRNKKITANLNRGLDLARGEIIARMDGDDICEIDRFEKQYEFLEKNKEITIVGSGAMLIDENGKFLEKKSKPLTDAEIRESAFIYSPFIHSAVMFRKGIIFSLGKYDERYIWAQDYALWLKWLALGNKGANLSQSLIQYRIHQNSSSKESSALARIILKIRKEVWKNGWCKHNFKNIFFMYAHFLLGIILSGRCKQILEQWYKRNFYEK